MAEKGGALQKHIAFAVLFGMSIVLFSFGGISYYFVSKNIDHLLANKLVLARLLSHNVDDIIQDNINRLYDISLSGSVDLADNDFGPELRALRKAYQYSIFTNGIFLLDKGGNMVLRYPEKIMDAPVNVLSIEPVSRMVALGKPVVSNVYTVEPTKRKVLFLLVPLKDKTDKHVGIAGGEIDPTNPVLSHMLRLSTLGQNTYIDIMDSNGMVLASSDPSRVLTYCNHDDFFFKVINEKKERVTTCHECHPGKLEKKRLTNMLTVVPLTMAPWGISVVQPEHDVFAPVQQLKKTFLIFFAASLGISLLIALGMSRSIIKPVHELIDATKQIAEGDLSHVIRFGGVDEIGMLSSSFEVMRLRLSDSLEALQRYNVELELRVRERTHEIKLSRKRVENLLKEVITAQEDERKRIARELHDDTLQDLSAILMRVDMCKLFPDKITPDKIEEVRSIVLKTLEDVLAVIRNLRPSLLDDLGLEAATLSLIDIHLIQKGIKCFFTTSGNIDRQLSPEVEITLFRIIQEAIANIAKHAEAKNVFFTLNRHQTGIAVDIEDDGKGFDLREYSEREVQLSKSGTGLGLLGIQERASLIDGSVEIFSEPGAGTRISLRIPIKNEGGAIGEDTSIDSR